MAVRALCLLFAVQASTGFGVAASEIVDQTFNRLTAITAATPEDVAITIFSCLMEDCQPTKFLSGGAYSGFNVSLAGKFFIPATAAFCFSVPEVRSIYLCDVPAIAPALPFRVTPLI